MYLKKALAIVLAVLILSSLIPACGFAATAPSASAQIRSADTFWEDLKAYEKGINSESMESFMESMYITISDMGMENLLWIDDDTFSFDLPGKMHCIYDYKTRKTELESDGDETGSVQTYGSERGAGSAKDVFLVGPYYGYDSSFTDFYRNLAVRIANATGGTATVLSGTAATPAAIKARLAQKRDAVCLFDSHGISENGTSYLLIRSSDGITSADLQNKWAASVSGVYGIDARCMTNGQSVQISNCFMWFATCEGMMRSGLSVPFVNCGAAAVYGYSKSVSFHGDYAYAGAFWNKILDGVTVADAISYMKQQCGECDTYGINAYPIVVSPEDPYPSNVNTNQTVRCTWSLYSNSVYYITYNSNGGQNEPQRQRVEADENTHTAVVKLSDTVPYKFPYTFSGWGVENNGLVSYQPGDTITVSDNMTLYAVWYVSSAVGMGQNKLTVRYSNTNEYRKFSPQADGSYSFSCSTSDVKAKLLTSGGSELSSGTSFSADLSTGTNYYLCFSAQTPQDFTMTISGSENYTLTYSADGAVKIPAPQSGTSYYTVTDEIPDIFGMNFSGWSANPNSLTAEYKPGDTISLTSDTTLYAVWTEPAQISGSIVLEPFFGAKRYCAFTAFLTGEYNITSTEDITVYTPDEEQIAYGSNLTIQLDAGSRCILCFIPKDIAVVNITSPALTGDVNEDGIINTADATYVLKFSAGILPLAGNSRIAADVNRNGIINTADAVLILKYAAGMIISF